MKSHSFLRLAHNRGWGWAMLTDLKYEMNEVRDAAGVAMLGAARNELVGRILVVNPQNDIAARNEVSMVTGGNEAGRSSTA